MVRLNRTPFSHLKIYGLTVHIIQNFSIFQKRPIKSKFQQIMQIPRSSPTQSANYAKLAHFVKLILCFRHLPPQRTMENSSELRRFRAVRPHSPRITRNSHHLLTLYITFQMPDQWQGMP